MELLRDRNINNAIDHSDADSISIEIKKNATTTEILIYDSGVGIFKKIMDALGLPDQEYALLELAKGGFTTDPSRHSGQGIFFSSRMVDNFYIFSRTIGHSYADEIFRVFANANPAIQLLAINTNNEVNATVNQARRASA